MNQGVRLLFKSCFRNRMFALVPYEVWRDLIVAQLDSRTIGKFVQLSKGCKKITEQLGEYFYNLAKRYRIEDNIPVAKAYLRKAKHCYNSEAMYEVGYASCTHIESWGILYNFENGLTEIVLAATHDNVKAWVWLVENRDSIRTSNAKSSTMMALMKALKLSEDPYAIAFCYEKGIGIEQDWTKAFKYYKRSVAENGNGHAEYRISRMYQMNAQNRYAAEWALRAAEQGLCEGQHWVYKYSVPGEDNGVGRIWQRKMYHQRCAVTLLE